MLCRRRLQLARCACPTLMRRLQSCRLEYPTSPTTRWSRLGLPRGRHPRSGTDPRTRPATHKLTSWSLKRCRAHDRESRGPPDVAAVRPGHFDFPSTPSNELRVDHHQPTFSHPPSRAATGRIEDLGYAATPQQGAPTYGAVCHIYLPFPTTTRTREGGFSATARYVFS